MNIPQELTQAAAIALASPQDIAVGCLHYLTTAIKQAKPLKGMVGVCRMLDRCLPLSALPPIKRKKLERLLQYMTLGMNNVPVIFSHRCTECGELMFSGRSRHAACCPYDGFPLTHYGLTPVVIGFAGGPSSGKTHLLCRSLATLKHIAAPGRNWLLDWQSGDEHRFLALRSQYEHDAILSTANELPVALRMRLQSGARVDRMPRVYDPGGEAFQEQDSINSHSYYQCIAGICFVIDPFSQKSVRRALGTDATTLDLVRPADGLTETWFERLLEVPGISRANSQSNVALALIISKMNAGQLLTHVRETYAGESDDEVGRAFLADHALGSILSQADSHFRHVRVFFSGDSLEPEFDPAAPLL